MTTKLSKKTIEATEVPSRSHRQEVLVEALKALARDCKAMSKNLNDDNETKKKFHTLFACGLYLLARSQSEIGFEIGIDRATVGRWLAGESNPHPLIRKQVVEWLYSQLKTRLKEEENRSNSLELAEAIMSLKSKKSFYRKNSLLFDILKRNDIDTNA